MLHVVQVTVVSQSGSYGTLEGRAGLQARVGAAPKESECRRHDTSSSALRAARFKGSS